MSTHYGNGTRNKGVRAKVGRPPKAPKGKKYVKDKRYTNTTVWTLKDKKK